MNIFMFVNYTPSDQSLGITKKISSEINALKELGHSVTHSEYRDDGVYIIDSNDKVIYKKKYHIHNKRYVRYRRYFMLVSTALEFINRCDYNYDILYGRLLAPSNNYLKMLKSFKIRGGRIILEAHAYFPGIRFSTMKGKYISYMLDKNGPKLKGIVDRILTEGHVDDFYGISEVKEARIGVETERIKKHQYVGSKNELNLISVANEMPYHAYDRIVKSLNDYYERDEKLFDIKVHLVGSISSRTVGLIHSLNLQDKVFLYGKKYGDELDAIYDKCNVGLGPLGQHRIGGKKDTGLKTKEYFAKGLPYIYSGEEPSVPENYPYIHQCSNDESMIDFEDVWNFYNTYRDNEEVTDIMRDFAKIHYSWKAIMEDAIS